MTTVEYIKSLDDEILQLSYIEDKCRRYIRREDAGTHKEILKDQLRAISRRLDRAQFEYAELYDQYLLEILRAKRKARYAVIEPKAPVRFFGIETAAEAIAA